MSGHTVDRTLQKGLVWVYAFGAASGVAATVFSPPAMLETIGKTSARVWGLYMLAGGLVCLVGVLMRRGARGDWLGEFVGIPLVTIAVIVYGVVAAKTLEGTPGRLAGICLFGMLSSLLIVRWFRVWDDGRLATGDVRPHRGLHVRLTWPHHHPPTPPHD